MEKAKVVAREDNFMKSPPEVHSLGKMLTLSTVESRDIRVEDEQTKTDVEEGRRTRRATVEEEPTRHREWRSTPTCKSWN